MNRSGIFFLFLLVLNLFPENICAHSGKPKHHIIIDTDGEIDDMRALSMFLSGNEIRVLAITCSQGNLMPDVTCKKTLALLESFHHQGIPVGKNPEVDHQLPVCSDFAKNITWGEKDIQPANNYQSNTDVINKALKDYPEKVTLIALGSLKTYAGLFTGSPEIKNKIDRIIWYNDHKIEQGFNYKISPESYQVIKKTGIALEIVDNNSHDYPVDSDYLNYISTSASPYARQISHVHAQAAVRTSIQQNHLHLWDDFVPLYLTVPILFNRVKQENISFISLQEHTPKTFVYSTISKLLESASTSNNRVFQRFPIDSSLYKPAYREIIKETINKHGKIEWKAICMTNEIHGHTGIYSIIGAKMGIRAMEYFNIGVNNMNVKTFAGNKPPLSCFNDGIQISTGATIGQGLITISDTVKSIPEAIFEFNNREVSFKVKSIIANRMKGQIKYGIEKYGLLTEEYWIYIEELAIQYWINYDRNHIFEIITLDEKG